MKNYPEPIDNYANKMSSALYFDLRNSTRVIRTLSMNGDEKKDIQGLRKHTGFMMKLNRQIYGHIIKNRFACENQLALNDTGDGHIFLFWNETHAWACLEVAIELYKYLDREIESHNAALAQHLSKDLKLDFGFGLHSGGSLVYKNNIDNRTFMYGIVLNSAARLESFTKNFVETRILLSNFFVSTLEKQYTLLKNFHNGSFNDWKKKFLKDVTTCHADIKDSKKGGHILHTVTEEAILNWSHCKNVTRSL